jgi:di/tricarboxylate transporter
MNMIGQLVSISLTCTDPSATLIQYLIDDFKLAHLSFFMLTRTFMIILKFISYVYLTTIFQINRIESVVK